MGRGVRPDRPRHARCSNSRPDAAAEDAAPLPFEDVLRPAVASAWQDLQARAGSRGLARFSPAAVAALQGSLLRRLSGAAAQALFADFTLFRHLARFRPGTLPGPVATSTGRRRYHAFVAAWRSGRDRDFFLANPVAARIIGTTVVAWLESTAELVERLDRDVAALSGMFAAGATWARSPASRPTCPIRTAADAGSSFSRSPG